MADSNSSEQDPLFPNLGASSVSASLPLNARQDSTLPAKGMRKYRPSIPRDDHGELKFLRVVGRHGVTIARKDDVVTTREPRNEGEGPSIGKGRTMQVQRGLWKDKAVAIKSFRKVPVIRENGEIASEYMKAYEEDLTDLHFELQIASHRPLCEHRNILKLLAVSFSCWIDSEAEENIGAEPKQRHFVLPVLILELAHEIYPDLRIFFKSHPDASDLSFDVVASLIADIADGLTALHDHGIVHADIKPANILLFPDLDGSSKLVAKIGDFGFCGMRLTTGHGKFVHFAGNNPRGITMEWTAPECLWRMASGLFEKYSQERLKDFQYNASRDVYSFGLLSGYIVLGGRSPADWVPDLMELKVSDGVIDNLECQLKRRLEAKGVEQQHLYDVFRQIFQETVRLQPESRIKSLDGIRASIFGHDGNQARRIIRPFVLNFNLFPSSRREMIHDGLALAYWKSPEIFRARVYRSFKSISSGMFGQSVPREVWECLESEPDHIEYCKDCLEKRTGAIQHV